MSGRRIRGARGPHYSCQNLQISTNIKQLLDRALGLSEEENATLTGGLIGSLEAEAPEEVEGGKADTVPRNLLKDRLVLARWLALESNSSPRQRERTRAPRSANQAGRGGDRWRI